MNLERKIKNSVLFIRDCHSGNKEQFGGVVYLGVVANAKKAAECMNETHYKNYNGGFDKLNHPNKLNHPDYAQPPKQTQPAKQVQPPKQAQPPIHLIMKRPCYRCLSGVEGKTNEIQNNLKGIGFRLRSTNPTNSTTQTSTTTDSSHNETAMLPLPERSRRQN